MSTFFVKYYCILFYNYIKMNQKQIQREFIWFWKDNPANKVIKKIIKKRIKKISNKWDNSVFSLYKGGFTNKPSIQKFIDVCLDNLSKDKTKIFIYIFDPKPKEVKERWIKEFRKEIKDDKFKIIGSKYFLDKIKKEKDLKSL